MNEGQNDAEDILEFATGSRYEPVLGFKTQANDQLPTPSTVAAYSIRRYQQVYLVNTR